MRVKLRWLTRYGFALVAVAVGLLLRLTITRWMGPGLPTYITFYPAVMLVALKSGFGPGLVATLAAALAADYWIIPPVGSLFIYETAIDTVGQVFFIGMGVFMSAVAERYRRIRRRTEELVAARTAELARANEQLQWEIAGH
jgi:K+-sensing histidine kinase KdpD